MTLGEVRGMIALRKPARFAIRHRAQCAFGRSRHELLRARNTTNLETGIARGEEDFVAVQGEEGGGSVLACDVVVKQDGEAAGVERGEFGEVEYFAVDYHPEVARFVVLI